MRILRRPRVAAYPRSHSGRRVLWAAGVLLLLSGCWAEEAEESLVQIEAPPAPGFVLPRLEGGETVSLESLAGKIVVLDFWATWCPPCALQVPVLNAFHAAHGTDGDVVLFGVSVDQVGIDEIRDWATEHDVRYPNLVGGDQLSRELGAVGFPALFVVGPDGRLQERHEGVIEAETLEAFLAKQRATKAAG